ncbi:sigma-70 family RNA polymerase sigma factor [Actinokineospora auranticolor]|uniref:RNA polymerase sigma-70 factor (ECF subfamily) n=1 Tax=Actinokineospora auranticolor TaxID=155976 RepID=A0A2S6GZI4_9PSEU|nr:sigma-70 family RNA polymerase sigma factor [Actinokineospora auranticolor]PPK70633.1 RNA polymerase sigma-70 factor (ECF subfamily) [Actinokineospora auranticolor]
MTAETIPDDRPDLTGARAGAELTRLYAAHARDLHRYLARRLTPAAADDLVAETFLIAWERRATYSPGRASARAWLFGIATNLARRHARDEVRGLRAHTRAGPEPDTAEAAEVRATARADAANQTAALSAGLAGLSDEERDALLLVAWAGLTPKEVAEALGINPTTVRTRLHRARTALRTHLTDRENRT